MVEFGEFEEIRELFLFEDFFLELERFGRLKDEVVWVVGFIVLWIFINEVELVEMFNGF